MSYFCGKFLAQVSTKEDITIVPKSRIEDYFILIYRPKHPRAENGYVPEHYLVAEKELGRKLTPDEDVRHRNGNTQDNRSSNLEVISMNADYRVQGLGDGDDFVEKRQSKVFMPCKFQRPCWKEIREPLARANNIFLPYHCSWQQEGDIYKCGHFWKYLEKEAKAKE